MIHRGLDSRLGGNDGVECGDDGGAPVVFGCFGGCCMPGQTGAWIPAFAGMTVG